MCGPTNDIRVFLEARKAIVNQLQAAFAVLTVRLLKGIFELNNLFPYPVHRRLTVAFGTRVSE